MFIICYNSKFQAQPRWFCSAVCYSLDNRLIVVHIPLTARDLFLIQSIHTSSGINKTFILQEHQWGWGHCIKQPWHTADQSLPSTAKVNGQWSYTSTPHMNGMHWHDFVFTLTQELKHCILSVKNNSPKCSSSLKVTGHT